MMVADAHCDTLYAMAVGRVPPDRRMVTRERLEAGGVGLQTFALYSGGKTDPGTPWSRAQAMLAATAELGVPLFTGVLPEEMPRTPHGILSIEGGEVFSGDLARFDDFAERGVKLVALTWNYENEIGYPATGGSDKGLKPFGKALLERMGARGVLADVSHLNDAGIEDVLSLSALPVIASHSNLRKLTDVPRNLTDVQARAIIASGGFIGVNFYARFLAKSREATVNDVLRVIDGLCELGGEHAVGFGSDFDGIEAWPIGLSNPADFPALIDALRRHGYTEAQCRNIAGENFRRVLKRAERPPQNKQTTQKEG